MTHHASVEFWDHYRLLPRDIQRLASQAYVRLKRDPSHPGLHFKNVGRFWAARVGAHHRALAVEADDGLVWFWIGRHAEYDKLIG